jgi:MSHA pilin protein MshD
MSEQKGFILIEATMAYLVLTLAIVFLVPMFIMTMKANKTTEKLSTASLLSRELLEEVRLRKWDTNTSSSTPIYISTPSVTLGIDAGETATNKTTFDDIDDFHGWTEAPPSDPLGSALSDFSTYSRKVTVEYVDSSLSVAGSTTDYKRVVACTKPLGMNDICLWSVFTNR